MYMKTILSLLTVLLATAGSFAQTRQYTLDVREPVAKEIKLLPMQGSNPDGHSLGVNNQYFLKDGKPWFPLMGELHYNRVPPEEWAEEVRKMKNGGLSIVATYIFWNEHERTQGVWDWTGNRDLRRFIGICRENGMYVWLRIGPWSHGEQLHGGFPEWIQQMKGRRRNDPDYLAASKILFDHIGKQTKGLFFKDGGPVIGTQLENEYASGDITHISELKKMALAAKITPVYWSVTANTVFDDSKTEVIPLQGSYPYRGWEPGGGKATKDFLYANDQWIMNDAFGKLYYNVNKYPKGLCEQGAGSQQTYNNRFVVEPHVVEAHLQNQIGKGMNLVGYYMFHGGTQTPGLEEPGYLLSYDFQSPITEFGLLRPSYKYLKILHNFVNDFGTDLATMQVVKPHNPVMDEQNTTDLRYVARVRDNSGFLFLCNTQVRVPMPDKEIAIQVQLKDEVISFPKMLIKGQTAPILPFNLKAQGVTIKYATAQPFARITDGNHTTLFFFRLPGVTPAFELAASGVAGTKAPGWKSTIQKNSTLYTSTGNEPVTITGANGGRVTMIFLSRTEAEQAWRTVINDKEAMILTNADVMVGNNHLELRQLANPAFSFSVYPATLKTYGGISSKTTGLFRNYVKKVKIAAAEVITSQKPVAVVNTGVMVPASLNDWVLAVHYQGGAIEASTGNKPAADDLYNGGGPWMVPLKRFSATDSGLRLEAKPWKEQITGVPDALSQKIKNEGPAIHTIEMLPQYKLVIK